MLTKLSRIGAAAIVLIGLSCAVTPGAAQPAAGEPVVGKSAAVNKDATINGRVIEIGGSIVHKERIKTDGRGSVQVLFIDRTTLTIGPNSDLTIDEYVFDPRKAGKLSVRLQSGLMRIVGGQITHHGVASVETRPATIGIRGGVADISTNGTTTTVSNSFGVVTVRGATGGTVTVPQGFTGTTGAVGSAPTFAVTTQTQVNNNNQQFQSKPGQTGGVSSTVSTTAATISGTKTTITSTITPGSTPAAGSTASGPPGGGTPGSNPAATLFSGGLPPQVTTTTSTVQTSSGNSGAAASPPPGGKGGGCCT